VRHVRPHSDDLILAMRTRSPHFFVSASRKRVNSSVVLPRAREPSAASWWIAVFFSSADEPRRSSGPDDAGLELEQLAEELVTKQRPSKGPSVELPMDRAKARGGAATTSVRTQSTAHSWLTENFLGPAYPGDPRLKRA
jgi:hypothetical protein